MTPALAGSHLPSSIPGSLAHPALVGGIQRHYVGAGRNLRRPFPAWPFVALGRCFVWPLYGRLPGVALLLWWSVMLAALWQRRADMTDALEMHLASAAYGASIPLTIALIHLISQSSTAALYRRLTHAHPRVGLPQKLLPFPHLRVDTGGRAGSCRAGNDCGWWPRHWSAVSAC